MYNLFVDGNIEAWQGEPWIIEATRCVNEYTDNAIIERFGQLDEASIQALKKMPSIFAYETNRMQNPKFGLIRDVVKRQGQVRIEYEIIPISPFLVHEDINRLSFDLDIDIKNWEMNRTHWAVKEVNLSKELLRHNITLPTWAQSESTKVDISSHHFDVALSFPGETRPLVEEVVGHLKRLMGPNTYFYDNNYQAQLARPSLDTLLQDIYGRRAKLLVVFLSADYQSKDWFGIEFRAIKTIMKDRQYTRIMLVRTDDANVEGIFSTDGYIDSRTTNPDEIATFIKQRVSLL
jgi:hypothetical protein